MAQADMTLTVDPGELASLVDRIAALEQHAAETDRELIRLEGERSSAVLRIAALEETVKALATWNAELHEAFALTVTQTGTMRWTETNEKGQEVEAAIEIAAPWQASPLSTEGEREARHASIGTQIDDAKRAGAAFTATTPDVLAAEERAKP